MQSSFRGVCSYVQHRCNVDLRFTKVNFSLVVEWMWNCVRVLYQGEHFYLFIRFLMFCLPLKLELWFSAGSLISLVSLPWNNSLMMLSRWLPSGAACQERFGHAAVHAWKELSLFSKRHDRWTVWIVLLSTLSRSHCAVKHVFLCTDWVHKSLHSTFGWVYSGKN